MDLVERNKMLILEYSTMMSSGPKTEDMIRQYTDNENYIRGVLMYDSGFPNYSIFIEEITAENDDVIVHGVFSGIHRGEIFGVPATNKLIEFPMMVKYKIKNGKIVDAWPMSDQMLLFEQLGILNNPNR